MALTESERNAVKGYLGYSLVPADAWRNGSGALDRNIDSLTAAGEASVRAKLAELAAVDASLTAARGRLKATQVGDLTLDARRELATLRHERREFAAELAALLGVCPPSKGAGQVVV